VCQYRHGLARIWRLEGRSSGAHLVGLVVVLGVVLEDLLLLGVLPSRHRVVELDLLPPLLAVDEPASGSACISAPVRVPHTPAPASAWAASYICLESWTSNLRARRNRSCPACQQPFRPKISCLAAKRSPYQCERVEALGKPLGLEHQPQLVHLGLLQRSQEAGVSVLGDGRRGRELVVIVLGIELQGRGLRLGGHGVCCSLG
jgi:hypothetical protein